MIKKAKDTMKIAIIILLGILTFNIVYDVGVSSSLKIQEENAARDVTSLDRVKAIAEQEVAGSATQRQTVETESKKSKVIKYISIVGILILAIAMLIILSNKEDLDE